MVYGLNPRRCIEEGLTGQAAKIAAMRPSDRFLAWRKLDAERRLSAIESALKSPANDVADCYPLAL